MKLENRVKTNIRHFIYYLVNGTLDFDLLNNKLKVNYHEYLSKHPYLFFQTCCLYINYEFKNKPDWPPVKRCAEYICNTISPLDFKNFPSFADWELNFEIQGLDFANSFKDLAYRFSIFQLDSSVEKIATYESAISDGASFVEQCFAIWANVIELENGIVINQDWAISRVIQYIKSYYIRDFKDDLEAWECELL